ncbi:hypothetical protein [Nocardioides sp.]|uniref:hypothetical protein n=1 Tax=Nocardioides sp. TaxID=35761 RepID=UPI002D7FE3D2|nr:hypothetical protein [Nocardioides sp.]
MHRHDRPVLERLGGLQDLQERLSHVGAVDSVLADEDPGEDRIVERTSCFVVGVPVERPYVSEQPKALRQNVGTRRERRSAVGVIGLESEPLLSQCVDALSDLVLR